MYVSVCVQFDFPNEESIEEEKRNRYSYKNNKQRQTVYVFFKISNCIIVKSSISNINTHT